MDYSTLNLPVVEARVDWITATAARGHRADDLIRFAEMQMLGEETAGGRFEDWRFQGYRGFSCGDVRWGWGKQGACTVWSRELSHIAAPALSKLADHWSRVDYCVTVFDVTGEVSPSDDWWAVYKGLYPDGNHVVRLSRLQELGAGSTVALGARTAATYCRAYDKHYESKGDYAKGCWRWELELKREQSEAQQKRWASDIVFQSYILGLVKGWPEVHQLPCPWVAAAKLEPCHQLRHSRDIDRTLEWLERQVTPSVEWASQVAGEQRVKEVLRLR